jgi:endonuclease/exonuclease/phosphatase family metal-dependent hydrolase
MSCTTAFGSITLVDIYGQTGATISKSSAILQKAFTYAGDIGKPAIIAGDFNQPPHEVQGFLDTFQQRTTSGLPRTTHATQQAGPHPPLISISFTKVWPKSPGFPH